MIAPFIFTYLRFNETRDLEYVKHNTLNFGGENVTIEPTIDFLCDSTKSVVWSFVPLNEEKPNADSSIIQAKINHYDVENLNNYSFQFLLVKKDSTIILHKYIENDRGAPKNKGFQKIRNAYLHLKVKKKLQTK